MHDRISSLRSGRQRDEQANDEAEPRRVRPRTDLPSSGDLEGLLARRNTARQTLPPRQASIEVIRSTGEERCPPSPAPGRNDGIGVEQAAGAATPELAQRQHQNRLRDSTLIDHLLVAELKAQEAGQEAIKGVPLAMRHFACHLVKADPHDSLSSFLGRWESIDTAAREAAERELAMYIEDASARYAEVVAVRYKRRVRRGLGVFEAIPAEQRDARRGDALRQLHELQNTTRLRALLPDQEQALIRNVRPFTQNLSSPSLVHFSSKLLLNGHGGLEGWLQMQRDGRADMALRLLGEMFSASNTRDIAALDKLQEQAGVPGELRLRVGERRLFFADIDVASPLEANVGRASGEEQRAPNDSVPMLQISTLPDEDAVRWFDNRMDDAWLLNDIFMNEAPGERSTRKDRRAVLNRFAGSLGLDSLRSFLTRWSSPDDLIRKTADELVQAFIRDGSKNKAREEVAVRQGLDELAELRVEQRHADRAALEQAARQQASLSDLLPPHEQQMIRRIVEEVSKRSPTSAAHSRAALAHFIMFLFCKRRAGLSEWLTMQRKPGLQGKDEARTLFKEYLDTLPKKSKQKTHITQPLHLAQVLGGVEGAPLVSNQNVRAGRSNATPHEGMATASRAADSNPAEQLEVIHHMRGSPRFMTWGRHRQRRAPARQAAPIVQTQMANAVEIPVATSVSDIHLLLSNVQRLIDAVVQMQRHPTLGIQRAAFLVDVPAELLRELVDERGQLHADVQGRLGNVPAQHVAGVSELLDRLRQLQAETAPEADLVPAEVSAEPLNPADKGKRVAISSAGEASGSPGSLFPTISFGDVPRRARTATNASRQAAAQANVEPAETKLEPMSQHLAAPVPRPPTYMEAELDQARTEFHRLLGEVCDLTGDHAQWSAHLDREDRVLVRHQMEPRPENDYKFPLRDPINPLLSVHKRYAGEDGKCHPNVSIRRTNATNPKGVKLGSGLYSYLQEMAESDDRLRLDSARLREVVDRLEDEAVKQLEQLIVVDRLEDAQLERLIREEPTGQPCARPRLLEESHVQPHERMLIGQYGLFVRRPQDPAEYPTLSNGRILGFYMGALVENRTELAQLRAAHPDYERYAIDARRIKKRRVMYSAMGSANSLAFANTALLPEAGKPAFDRKRLNALFIEFEVSLTDRENRPRREHVVALVALDNLFDGDEPEMQVLVDYGETFLAQFQQPDGDHTEQPKEPEVKREPEDEQ